MLLLFKHYGISALGISLGLRRYFIVYPSSRHNTVTVYVASFKEKLCMMKRCDYCLKRQRGHWNKQVESNLCKVLFQKMLFVFKLSLYLSFISSTFKLAFYSPTSAILTAPKAVTACYLINYSFSLCTLCTIYEYSASGLPGRPICDFMNCGASHIWG